MDFNAILPICFRSSPWPAIPITKVAKSKGAMSDLIIRKNIEDIGFRFCAVSGKQ
jgi:hypothetical protein